MRKKATKELTYEQACKIRQDNIDSLCEIRKNGADALKIQAIQNLEKIISKTLENIPPEDAPLDSIEIIKNALKE